MNSVGGCCNFPDVQMEKQRVRDFCKFSKAGREIQKNIAFLHLVKKPQACSPDFHKLRGIQRKVTSLCFDE